MGRFLPKKAFYSEEKLKTGNENGIILFAKNKIRTSRNRPGSPEWDGEGSVTCYFQLQYFINGNAYEAIQYSKSDNKLIINMIESFNELYNEGGFKSYYRKLFVQKII